MIRRDNCDGLLGVAKRVLILEAVARTSTRREAARLLGMNQGSLSTYLRQYGFAPYERPEALPVLIVVFCQISCGDDHGLVLIRSNWGADGDFDGV